MTSCSYRLHAVVCLILTLQFVKGSRILEVFILLLLLMYYVVERLFTALRHWHRRHGILLLLFKIYIFV